MSGPAWRCCRLGILFSGSSRGPRTYATYGSEFAWPQRHISMGLEKKEHDASPCDRRPFHLRSFL